MLASVHASIGREIVDSQFWKFWKSVYNYQLIYNSILQTSFDNLHKWLQQINENASPDVQLTLLANKCDLKKEDDDHYLQAKVWYSYNSCMHVYSSYAYNSLFTVAELKIITMLLQGLV